MFEGLIINIIIISTLFIMFGLMNIIEGQKVLRLYWDNKPKLEKEIKKVKQSLWVNVITYAGVIILHLYTSDALTW
ncbi:hypothetical protein SUREIYA_01770 [Serratia phage vB_SmaM-Sureiya]|nr:hypothetical protein SUREIYA_01770 [Serratia phage vB_SmaM-Sureiya]